MRPGAVAARVHDAGAWCAATAPTIRPARCSKPPEGEGKAKRHRKALPHAEVAGAIARVKASNAWSVAGANPLLWLRYAWLGGYWHDRIANSPHNDAVSNH